MERTPQHCQHVVRISTWYGRQEERRRLRHQRMENRNPADSVGAPHRQRSWRCVSLAKILSLHLPGISKNTRCVVTTAAVMNKMFRRIQLTRSHNRYTFYNASHFKGILVVTGFKALKPGSSAKLLPIILKLIIPVDFRASSGDESSHSHNKVRREIGSTAG